MKDTQQPAVEPADRAAWRAWLDAHPDESGVWLVVPKGAGSRLTYDDAVEEAVAFGWVDSKANRLDETRYKQWFSPRKKGSHWAASNKERVSRLIESGQMTARGLAAVEAARADGSWDAPERSQAR